MREAAAAVEDGGPRGAETRRRQVGTGAGEPSISTAGWVKPVWLLPRPVKSSPAAELKSKEPKARTILTRVVFLSILCPFPSSIPLSPSPANLICNAGRATRSGRF